MGADSLKGAGALIGEGGAESGALEGKEQTGVHPSVRLHRTDL